MIGKCTTNVGCMIAGVAAVSALAVLRALVWNQLACENTSLKLVCLIGFEVAHSRIKARDGVGFGNCSAATHLVACCR